MGLYSDKSPTRSPFMNVRSACPPSPTVMGGKSLSGSCYWGRCGNDKILPQMGPAEGSRRGLKSPRPYQSIFPECDVENLQTTLKPQAGRPHSPGHLLPGAKAVSQRYRWNRTASLPTPIVSLTPWGFYRLCYWPTPVSVWGVEWRQKVKEFNVWEPVPVQAFPQPPGRASKWQASPLQPFSSLSFFSAVLFQALDLFCFLFLWPVKTRVQHSHTRVHTPHPPFCSPPNVCRIYRLWCLETQSLSPLLSSFLLLLPAKACCCLIPSRKPPLSWGQVPGH